MLSTQRIVLASGNTGKLKELQSLLQPLGASLISQSELGITDIEETGLTFIENALLKARHASEVSGLPAIADDSGLAVNALAGAPGLYSARYAADTVGAEQWAAMPRQARDDFNNTKLLLALRDLPDDKRGAAFHSVIVYLRHAHDPVPIVCHGIWHGRILQTAYGQGGFGYDPLFYVASQDCSAAQLPADVKNALSHRGKAMHQLLAQLSAVPD